MAPRPLDRLGRLAARAGDRATKVGEAARIGERAARVGEAARIGERAARVGEGAAKVGERAAQVGELANGALRGIRGRDTRSIVRIHTRTGVQTLIDGSSAREQAEDAAIAMLNVVANRPIPPQ
jgi:hypothetical protein